MRTRANHVGEVWIERWGGSSGYVPGSHVFLVLSLTPSPEHGAPTYKLLNLENGELDRVARRVIDDPAENWERLA